MKTLLRKLIKKCTVILNNRHIIVICIHHYSGTEALLLAFALRLLHFEEKNKKRENNL